MLDSAMRKLALNNQTIWIMDSISYIKAIHQGCIIVSASHGGLSSARYALAQAPLLTVFNDAGIGKDNAGIAALGALEDKGLAAIAISANSARIGDGEDTWENAIISELNQAAVKMGFVKNRHLKTAILDIFN